MDVCGWGQGRLGAELRDYRSQEGHVGVHPVEDRSLCRF